ncbi:putative ATPase [Agrobacterium tumefaciens]|uniref:AAA family ATPase n=1 Tax=Agrobacterium tumefaciens TaxID=358 RepID=UPI000DD75CF6|nr:AAA family ATPase [Agrobacterium tumefaciens]MBP2569011.1 putative ATPase [Agrobacterium tumefaciens]
MRIVELRLQSYGSFSDSGSVMLGPGLNFIVGQNNSGKSALISSLSSFANNPHRNAARYHPERLAPSHQSVTLSIPPSELALQALRTGGALYWPGDANGLGGLSAVEKVKSFFSAAEAKLSLARGSDRDFTLVNPPYDQSVRTLQFKVGVDLEITGGSLVIASPSPSLPLLVNAIWNAKVFFFNAQRYNVGVCQINQEGRLNADASNLPAVLMRLAGDRGDLFRELVQHMRDIFPSVKNLSVSSPALSQNLEILIWPTVEQRDPELSVGLNESGTGLSQVLAILTVAMTMERSVIVVDEISSFLHPAAAKALVRILESHYSQHQYIISTHSADVIAASSPSTVHLVKKNGFESSVVKIDLKDIYQLREITNELGVSMTDVFASDRIVWVEGPTEEKCFAYLFEQTREESKAGNSVSAPQFTAVVATGDFSRRARRDLVFEIYTRLSKAASSIESHATFAFDREELTAQQMDDLCRAGDGQVRFLPRRLFECYLLSPVAIARVINAELDEADAVSDDDVVSLLMELAGDPRFDTGALWSGSLSDEAWLKQVDAAKLLGEVFSRASDAKLTFQKRKHSFELMKDILEYNAHSLTELIDFVRTLAVPSEKLESRKARA